MLGTIATTVAHQLTAPQLVGELSQNGTAERAAVRNSLAGRIDRESIATSESTTSTGYDDVVSVLHADSRSAVVATIQTNVDFAIAAETWR
jgi:hypothetical protein